MKLLTRPSALGGVDLDAISGPIAKPTSGDILGQVVKGGTDFYGALNQINAAKYGSQLLKAQAKAQIAETKAGGAYAAQAARLGTPSTSLLLVGALALGALLILKK